MKKKTEITTSIMVKLYKNKKNLTEIEKQWNSNWISRTRKDHKNHVERVKVNKYIHNITGEKKNVIYEEKISTNL